MTPWNFAYGANINRWKLETKRGITPAESTPAALHGWALSFNHRGGMGTVQRAPGGVVHGVLHRLSLEQFAALNEMEHGYDPTEVTADAYDGRQIVALVYVSKPNRLIANGLPPLRYLKLLQEGAAQWGLDPAHISWLQAHPAAPQGECRNFARGACKFGAACRFRHAMADEKHAERAAVSVSGDHPSAPPGFAAAAPSRSPKPPSAIAAALQGRSSRVQSGALAGGLGGGRGSTPLGRQRHTAGSEGASGEVDAAPTRKGEAPRNLAVATWRLVYWPGFPGRGEFIRLLFEETGVAYLDDARPASVKAITREGKSAYPFFAAPVIENLQTGFQLSQTMSIVRYLARVLDGGRLNPSTPELQARADMLVESLADLVEEGHQAWHPQDRTRSAEFNRGTLQDVHIQQFATRRVPKWMKLFEESLASNLGGNGFFLGGSVSYVDLCMYHVLNGLQYQLPQEFRGLRIPKLRSLQKRIGELPRIQAYMQSNRRNEFTGTGPTF